MRTLIRISLSILVTVAVNYSLTAQQKISFKACDSLMVKNNTALLAAELDVSIAKAFELQATIRPLPELNLELNAYNPNLPKWFDIGPQGQKQANIQKLLQLGGKRKAEIELAKSSTQIARLELESIFRKMRTELASSFFENWYQRRKVEMLQNQVEVLDTLFTNYQLQTQKGNIALKELVRLQALISQVRNDYSDARLKLDESSKELALLTGLEIAPEPIISKQELEALFWRSNKLSADALVRSALTNNPDYLISIESSRNADLFYALQKARGVSDITLGAAYDQRGGAFNNQINLTLGVPLRLYNPNKGAIEAAKIQQEKSRLIQTRLKTELGLEVNNALNKLKVQQNELQKLTLIKGSELQEVFNGVMHNFNKRNIALMEFTDFIESYNHSIIRTQEVEHALIVTGFYLQELTTYDIFK